MATDPAADFRSVRGTTSARACWFGAVTSRYAGDPGLRRRSARCAGERYAGCDLVRVVDPQADGKLEPEALNRTDRLELSVHVNEKYGQVVLVARLDNLARARPARRCRISA